MPPRQERELWMTSQGSHSAAHQGTQASPGDQRDLEVVQNHGCLSSLLLIVQFLRVDQDKDRECSLDCAGSPQKSLCASDGRTFLSRCEFQRAKCKDPQLEIAYRGNCKDVSRCVAERKYTQEQARKEFQQVFIPECNDDGTYSQVEKFLFGVLHDWKVRVQCHSYTGYCWCVTPNGRPISGTAVAHKTPRCPGSVSEKLPQREGAGKTDDASAPALETQPQGDEEDIASRYPTLWTEQVKSRQNKTNKSSDVALVIIEASSCDQELQSALEEAKQPQKDNVFIPECAQGGLYKPVQCHPSTGYCWCVLVDTGRPIPGTSTRYEQPKCDNGARAHPTKTKDLYKGRQLQGCPGAKKNEFLTSVLDALSTDMVHAVSDPSLSSSRVSEPDPNHTLEERVVHWYFKQLDKNSSGDIGKKEIKPFKRFLRKKSKPKKCVKKFVEYCDVNNDKSLSVQELMGCLGVTKEEGILRLSLSDCFEYSIPNFMKLTLDNKPGSAHDPDIPPKPDSKENKNFCWVFIYQPGTSKEQLCTSPKPEQFIFPEKVIPCRNSSGEEDIRYLVKGEEREERRGEERRGEERRGGEEERREERRGERGEERRGEERRGEERRGEERRGEERRGEERERRGEERRGERGEEERRLCNLKWRTR
ncbi:hypothetical protein DUI87_10214 [Hirundo rustica rustica]|uniref:SPARC related modular calcium binding 2 n=1 Tax=Hirundo rustica rustica TaxID=333673 RepID=A0A3M0KNV9_HIRRU|nr:hypothetical protein DUI87_10214 [Hirundo rustica rustica]